MEVGDGEAEAGRRLEAAGGCVHTDGGRCERVVWWEYQGAPVLAIMVWSVGRTGQDVLPSVQILSV